MAAVVKHVRRRGVHYEYHRRVPLDVVRDTEALMRYFNGSHLFRRLLGTRDPSQVLFAADEKRREFEVKVALARGIARKEDTKPKPRPQIRVTADILAEITDQQRNLVLRPWIDAYLLAEQSPAHAEHLERMRDEREMFAEEIKALLTKPGGEPKKETDESPLQVAERLIDDLGLDAPSGSSQRSYVALAVRQGRLAGEKEIDLVLEGQVLPPRLEPALKSASRRAGATLRDAVSAYLADRSLRPKTARDVRVSLELFERLVGNKRLADLTRTDFKGFIEQLAAKQVGGRSTGSVVRMIAPGTVQKRLTFLRSAINMRFRKVSTRAGTPPVTST